MQMALTSLEARVAGDFLALMIVDVKVKKIGQSVYPLCGWH